jgi:hypothetical protein
VRSNTSAGLGDSSLFEQTDEINARVRATCTPWTWTWKDRGTISALTPLVVSIGDPWTLNWVGFNHYIGICGSAKGRLMCHDTHCELREVFRAVEGYLR